MILSSRTFTVRSLFPFASVALQRTCMPLPNQEGKTVSNCDASTAQPPILHTAWRDQGTVRLWTGNVDRRSGPLQVGYLPAFCLAQRRFWAAAIFARASGLKMRLAFLGFRAVGTSFSALEPFCFAQRARCAAAIRARPAADIPRFLGLSSVLALPPFPVPKPKIE